MASQRPLPTPPFAESLHTNPAAMAGRKREHSEQSTRSIESDDVDMVDSNGERHPDDGGAASTDESMKGDGTKSKKKKSQKFYCTDYPPCNLSFTRSEHLARHIRYATIQRHDRHA
jgi:hypothetical protein